MWPASERNRCSLRATSIGYVFQFGELLPELTVVENVALPLLLHRSSRRLAYARALDLLQRVGLGGRGEESVENLSGGEMQRVAVCRALMAEPALVVADEPTGSLDRVTALSICDLLVEACRASGSALVVATHDAAVARAMDRCFSIEDGHLKAVRP
jgi:predicted ABC-type transport system involved in lysophospholipase L1 biosynthesis ATPase subunit